MSNSRTPRKQWEDSTLRTLKTAATLKPAQPKVQYEYEQYLMLLQERNRFLKKLQRKDSHQVEMEKREQGFALYLNGANNGTRRSTHNSRHQADIEHDDLEYLPDEPFERNRSVTGGDEDSASIDQNKEIRAKTAPSKKRKSWVHQEVDLRTDGGQSVRIEPPEILSGNYEDDFEDETSSEEEGGSSSEGSDNDDDDEQEQSAVLSLSGSGEIEMSLGEISVLRETLESDSIIKESMLGSPRSAENYSEDDEQSAEEKEEKVKKERDQVEEEMEEVVEEDEEVKEGNEEVEGEDEEVKEDVEIEEEDENKQEPDEDVKEDVEEEVEEEEDLEGLADTLPQQDSSPQGAAFFHATNKISKHKSKTPRMDSKIRLQSVESSSTIETIINQPHDDHPASAEIAFPSSRKRTLSGVSRKKLPSSKQLLSNNVQDVLDAMQEENTGMPKGKKGGKSHKKAVDSKHSDASSHPPTAGMNKAVDALKEAFSALPKPGGGSSNPSLAAHSQKSSPVANAILTIADNLQPDSPQVNNQLLQSAATKKKAKPSKPIISSDTPEEFKSGINILQPTCSKQRSPDLDPQGKGDVLRQSVSGKTLKLITEKVRTMNSKQQTKLLELLGKMDELNLATVTASGSSGAPTTLSNSEEADLSQQTKKQQQEPPKIRTKKSKTSTAESSKKGKEATAINPTSTSTTTPGSSQLPKDDVDFLKDVLLPVKRQKAHTQKEKECLKTSTEGKSEAGGILPAPVETKSSKDFKEGKSELGRKSQAPDETKSSRDLKMFAEGKSELGRKSQAPDETKSSRDLKMFAEGKSELGRKSQAPDETKSSRDLKMFMEGKSELGRKSQADDETKSSRDLKVFTEGKNELGRKSQDSKQDQKMNLTKNQERANVKPVEKGDNPRSKRQTGLRHKQAIKGKPNEDFNADCVEGDMGLDAVPSSSPMKQQDRDQAEMCIESSSSLSLMPHQDRLKTAVLTEGRLPLVLIPCSDSSLVCHDPSTNQSGAIISRQNEVDLNPDDNMSCLRENTPTPGASHQGPQLCLTQQRQQFASSVTPLGYNECLASLTKFDHSCLGQMRYDLKDDVLETFLEDYRQSKKSRHATATSDLDPHTSTQHQSETERKDSGSQGLAKTAEPSYFFIPELPIGKELVINILSTWGDRYYVGLTGLEVYTASGETPNITQISAEPSDINVLPEYDGDPRVVTNLLDGSNQTRDDLHMWLTPYTPGSNHYIRLKFSIPYAIAMIRIWNYNKSRIHSSRGVRHVEMYLDSEMIFTGEVAKSTGSDTSGDSETILFTVDEEVLHRVSQHDPVFQNDFSNSHDYNPGINYECHRPKTADLDAATESTPFYRPFTSSSSSSTSVEAKKEKKKTKRSTKKEPAGLVTGSEVRIELISNWGDPSFIGLTGAALLRTGSQVLLNLRQDQVILSQAPSYGEGDDESLQSSYLGRLVDGVNVTTDADHMWVCPHSSSTTHCHSLIFRLDAPTVLSGLRVWNYNTSLEDTYKGVKLIQVYVDGSPVLHGGKGNLLRRAPGSVQYNFSQDILFHQQQMNDDTDKDEEMNFLPQGFVFQFKLFSTWGDPYYIGLNGLEFYDTKGKKIPLTENNIAAFPESVNILPGISGDLRIPNKLIDGVFDTDDGRHAWLAPVFPGITNSIFVIFDQAHTVSSVKLWNYGKKPARGVKEITLLLDDLLVFTGCLPVVPSYARGILPTLQAPVEPYVISFADFSQENGVVIPSNTQERDIQFTNNQTVVRSKQKKMAPDQDLRPLTSLTTNR